MNPALMIDYAALIKEAAIDLGTKPENIELYSWYVLFPSTCGPHHGRIGGNAFTKFQVIGFADKYSTRRRMYCDGIWKEWDGNFGGSWK